MLYEVITVTILVEQDADVIAVDLHVIASEECLGVVADQIIQIDADNKMLGLVKKISVGICGDAKAAAVALTARLDGKALECDATKSARAQTIADEKAAWERELDEWTHERDPFSLDMIEKNRNNFV